MDALKQTLRQQLPRWALDAYRRVRYGRTWFDFEDRSRQEVFAYIYERGVWGRGEGAFYSGPGSDPVVTSAYVAAIRRFLADRGITSVVDLGCGDFRVGAQLLIPGLTYHGVDIVPGLVEHNNQVHGASDIRFSCLDATVTDLPDGTLCLVREVFQHLSNDEIQNVLTRCRKFPYVVVTERIAGPARFTTPNVDIVHGPNTRADIGSGVILDAPPFRERVTGVLVETPQPDGTILRSVLIENAAQASS